MRIRLALALVLALSGCHRNDSRRSSAETPPAAATNDVRLREIDLARGVVESDAGELFSPASPTLRETLRALRNVAEDRDAGGLFLRVGPMLGNAARAEEIGEALERIRRAHKPVHCHFEIADNVAYEMMALHCDRIAMTPAGHLALVGVAAQAVYLRSLLASVGISAQLLQVGRFKGAADPVTRDDMPAEVRGSLDRILDLRQERLLRAVTTRAGGDATSAQRLVDEGPFDSDGARDARLVDDAEYDDEAREHAREASHATRVDRASVRADDTPKSFAEILRVLTAEKTVETPTQPYVAIVRVEGTIVDGERTTAGRTTSGPFVAELRRLAGDASCRAIVLRIDSPGGSALASDRMWHAVRRAVGARKPVVASVAGMAASGGYYVASAANEVFADDTSLVGSIGVVGGKVDVSSLLERIGAHAVVLSRGSHAGIFLPFRPFDASERATLQRLMERTYERFLARVSEGRGLTRERLSAAAEGRLLLAPDARSLGLVTARGGLEEALVRARTLGGLSSSAEIVEWPRKRPFFEALAGALGGDEALAPALGRVLSPELAPFTDVIELLRGPELTHVVLPLVLEVR